MPAGFWRVVLTPCNEHVCPETAVASLIFTCRQTMVWFLAWLAAAALCGDTMGLCRWKDGTGSFHVALCLSHQKARVPLHSPNKLELLFSSLQISKRPSQVKAKNSKSSHLELSALLIADMSSEASGDPQKKGQETTDQEACSVLPGSSSSVFSEHTHKTPEVSVPQGRSKNTAPPYLPTCLPSFWGFSRTFESDFLFCDQSDSRPGGFGQLLWQKSLDSSSWCQILHCFGASAGQTPQNPPPNLSCTTGWNEAVLRCAGLPSKW